MLTRKQDELFSHAARLALRGMHASKDGDRPGALRPLLDHWTEIEHLVAVAPAPARRVATRILESLAGRRQIVTKSPNNDALRAFGQECVLLFKIGRGDDPKRYPVEYADYL